MTSRLPYHHKQSLAVPRAVAVAHRRAPVLGALRPLLVSALVTGLMLAGCARSFGPEINVPPPREFWEVRADPDLGVCVPIPKGSWIRTATPSRLWILSYRRTPRFHIGDAIYDVYLEIERSPDGEPVDFYEWRYQEVLIQEDPEYAAWVQFMRARHENLVATFTRHETYYRYDVSLPTGELISVVASIRAPSKIQDWTLKHQLQSIQPYTPGKPCPPFEPHPLDYTDPRGTRGCSCPL